MGEKQNAQVSTGATKKKRDDKSSRRDPRAWDNVLRAVSNLTDHQKLTVVSEKYMDLYAELRKVVKQLQTMEKAYATLQREKDQLQVDQTRSILAKATMESLCRELQKQNKQIKEENLVKHKEEEEKRKEVAAKFAEKLNDITSMMEDNKDKSFKLRDENIKMTRKLTELHEQFKERDENIARMTKQMELSKQLASLQIQKLNTEKEMWDKERGMLEAKLNMSEANNKALEEKVTELQEYVDVYKGQYSDFETTMTKSNKIFREFKSEMNKMTKRVATLEKECNLWKTRYQTGASSVIELSQLHQTQIFEIQKLETKLAAVTSLCRQLQTDRLAFLKQLKANNIEPVESAAAAAEIPDVSPVAATSSDTTEPSYPPTKKEKELARLKENLKVLQEQIKHTILTETAAAEQLKTETEACIEANDVAENGNGTSETVEDKEEKQPEKPVTEEKAMD